MAYAAECHGIWLWGKQAAAIRALGTPPHRVIVRSANGIGKTLMSGLLAAWAYDCFDPSETIITGPTAKQIKDTTFKEVRRFLGNRPGMMPKAPRIEDRADHYINATTAGSATAFQGAHSQTITLIFEEAMGIASQFFTAARGIIQGSTRSAWLVIFNPTDGTSYVHEEEESGDWTVFSISALEHPNVHCGLLGLDPPIPGAVNLPTMLQNMESWGDDVTPWPEADRAIDSDVDLLDPVTYGIGPGASHFTARSRGDDGDMADRQVPVADLIAGAASSFPGRYWRPGPEGEARILGRYPAQSACAIFSETALTLARSLSAADCGAFQVGCDVARHGDDATVIHARRGRLSLVHETYRKVDTTFTAGRLKDVCRSLAAMQHGVRPESIPVLVDDTGVGGGVTDQRGGFAFQGVNFGQRANDPARYPNARSEMLFDLAAAMAEGRAGLGRLGAGAFEAIRRQASVINWRQDAQQRRVADPKDATKKRVGRSPDDLDAVALAYYAGRPAGPVVAGGPSRSPVGVISPVPPAGHPGR